MTAALCPECEAVVPIGNPLEVGKRVECSECGESLEVISLSPLDLDYFLDDDWDYDDEDWDDEEEDE